MKKSKFDKWFDDEWAGPHYDHENPEVPQDLLDDMEKAFNAGMLQGSVDQTNKTIDTLRAAAGRAMGYMNGCPMCASDGYPHEESCPLPEAMGWDE